MTPQTLTLEAALQQAVAHHQSGRLPEAEQLYRAILQVQPSQPDANHNLGVLAGQVGQHAAGLLFLKTALEANPAQGQYVLSYARALLATGKAGEALDILDAALLRGFNTPEAQALRQKAAAAALNATSKEKTSTLGEINRLAALFSAGQLAEMENQARLLLDRHPDSGAVWKALGVSLQMQGKDALPALKKATAFFPNDAEAHYNLGNALQDCGQLDEAVMSYRRMLEINPNDAEGYSNLGVALQNLGQPAAAVACLRRALEINPDNAEVYNKLGVALHDLGQFDSAVASYRRALEIKPVFAAAFNNLGGVLQDQGFLDAAVASYRRAIEIEPDHAEAHNNLGNALLSMGLIDSSITSYRRALEVKPDFADALSNLLFGQNYLADQPATMFLTEALRFGELAARQARPYASWHNTPDPARCLRVGLVSGDLRNHPVGYFLESLLSYMALTRMELIAYPTKRFEDELTARIKSRFSAWKPLAGLSDKAAANLIHADGIDILIDLSGHTAHNRLPLFAWKPAPVQASWLGYFATTGMTAMDYFLADPWTAPEAEEHHFTEKIQRLPETYLCFTPPHEDVYLARPQCADLAASRGMRCEAQIAPCGHSHTSNLQRGSAPSRRGINAHIVASQGISLAPLPALTNGYITFGCFNNLTKMNDAVVALWARVLSAAPGSRLFLKTKQLGETAVRQSTLKRFAAHGIDANRLILEGAAPRAELLAAYRRVDIALDPFPYPGGATSAEALWMGAPVLTLAGERFLSHIGESILQNAGLPEWIATDADDYVAKAAKYAGDLQRLAVLRDGLRQQVSSSPLFDAPRFARHFEAALRDMWRKWCGSRAQAQAQST